MTETTVQEDAPVKATRIVKGLDDREGFEGEVCFTFFYPCPKCGKETNIAFNILDETATGQDVEEYVARGEVPPNALDGIYPCNSRTCGELKPGDVICALLQAGKFSAEAHAFIRATVWPLRDVDAFAAELDRIVVATS
jgi:hypothetical protein